jgi:hypothetical protein
VLVAVSAVDVPRSSMQPAHVLSNQVVDQLVADFSDPLLFLYG